MGRKLKYKIGDKILEDTATITEVIPSGTPGVTTKLKILCSLYGKEKTINQTMIRKSVSCGCQRHNSGTWKRVGAKNRTWQLPVGEAAFNNLYTSYKNRALRAGLPFSLSVEKFREVVTSQCHYCDKEPSQVSKGLGKSSGDFVYNGVDRVNSALGYTEDNIVPCCKMCNFMKLNYTVDEFLDHIKRIYNKNYGFPIVPN